MYARKGDRIVVRAPRLDHTDRFAEVLEVDHDDGTPPYVIRWTDTGELSLFFAGPDAFVDRETPSYEPEYEWTPEPV
ncbi:MULTISPECIES: DUF1918 domain-containing protein [unclassified Nocardioides]|uniref:DUF1918 domain-containing protein n=1 Tax=unclassified Nocardioides TaxID=2615069 RepID=UPI0009F0B50C|nr:MULTISPECIES: DUF1918 domain-containing protein [unclassified Nocardioides]GAW50900.1 Putative DNA-binding protein [Nocardioides sp. PD653-B2]GAW54058.1 putative DNA-binding protein [Nocardioides sp. PD653]